MSRVLTENEDIFIQINKHAKGGPSPKFPGIPAAAQQILNSSAGRAVSVEWAAAMQESFVALVKIRVDEASSGRKRPENMLYQHVTASSHAISAYVARLIYMVEGAQ